MKNKNNCFIIVGAYSCFLANMLSGSLEAGHCFVLAVLMYYFYLAAFFWMLNIAINVARTLKLATTQLRYNDFRCGASCRHNFIYQLHSLGSDKIPTHAVDTEFFYR